MAKLLLRHRRDLCCRKSADMLRKPKPNSELQATEHKALAEITNRSA
jgi:hypothetical protein